MSSILIVAILTQFIFLIGEAPMAGYLKLCGFSWQSLSHFSIWLFTVTRFFGIAGQIYLWSSTELGKVSAITGAIGIVASNFIGVFILHQKSLSFSGLVGLSFVILGIILLTRTT
jgi:multidrug transporter EmrE-like cation transporter